MEHKDVLQEEGIQLSQLKRREISHPVLGYIMSIHSLNRPLELSITICPKHFKKIQRLILKVVTDST